MVRHINETTNEACHRNLEEEQIRERIDEQGNKWVKVYFGGGNHLKNWLEQCQELGEVQVEEVSHQGLKCYEDGGEKLYRIWLKIGSEELNDLY